MKELWDPTDSVKNNMMKMGVAFDANKAMSHQGTKAILIARAKKCADFPDEPIEENSIQSEVIKRLEDEAAEAEANLKPTFRFTREQCRWITYCLDKHGDDFKAMAKDAKNIWQETPKQIRQKVLKFISIPEQFTPYAKERGLLDEITIDNDTTE